MKKSSLRLTLLIMVLLLFSSLAYAEDDGAGSLSIGLHGIGSRWNYGQPMLRWRPSDSWAFDFTPTVHVREAGDTDNQGGSTDYDGDTYGLSVGIVKMFRSIAGISIGWCVEVGYAYSSFSSSYDYSGTTNSSNYRTQIIDFGFGPDFEYFVPSIPGLSIGASAQIHYRYVSETYNYEYPSTSYSASYRAKNIDLLGELLTVRYYF